MSGCVNPRHCAMLATVRLKCPVHGDADARASTRNDGWMERRLDFWAPKLGVTREALAVAFADVAMYARRTSLSNTL